jgi:hypothetical protein
MVGLPGDTYRDALLRWSSRVACAALDVAPLGKQLDWGSKPRLLAAGIARIVVFVLLLLSSYISTSADPWTDWYD